MSKVTVKINRFSGRTAPGAKPSNGTISRLSVDPHAEQTKMHSPHTYDHGIGPSSYTRKNKSVARTGPSQNAKQTYIGKNGVATGTANK